MKSVWAAREVVLLLAFTATLCLHTLALATLSARHVVPLVARHRAAPEPVVEFKPVHGHPKKSKVVRESAVNPPVVQEPTMQHKATPDQGAAHKFVPEPQPKYNVVPELEPMHKLDPESSLRHKVVPESSTSNKVALEPEEKFTVISDPEVENIFANKLLTKDKLERKPAVERRVPGALRPEGEEALPLLRPGHWRPGNEAEVAATTTTTTTVDSFTAFCQEACKAGVGGPECNCPGHPVGRRHAPPFTL